jgi:hypothetical protein
LDIDVIAPRKMQSPSKIEKRLPPSDRPSIAELVIKPPGKPTLADANDKRPAYAVQSLEAFDVEEDEDSKDE